MMAARKTLIDPRYLVDSMKTLTGGRIMMLTRFYRRASLRDENAPKITRVWWRRK